MYDEEHEIDFKIIIVVLYLIAHAREANSEIILSTCFLSMMSCYFDFHLVAFRFHTTFGSFKECRTKNATGRMLKSRSVPFM